MSKNNVSEILSTIPKELLENKPLEISEDSYTCFNQNDNEDFLFGKEKTEEYKLLELRQAWNKIRLVFFSF